MERLKSHLTVSANPVLNCFVYDKVNLKNPDLQMQRAIPLAPLDSLTIP